MVGPITLLNLSQYVTANTGACCVISDAWTCVEQARLKLWVLKCDAWCVVQDTQNHKMPHPQRVASQPLQYMLQQYRCCCTVLYCCTAHP